MATKRSVADVIIAVQEGLADAASASEGIGTGSSSAVLNALADGNVHTVEEVMSATGLSAFRTVEALQALEMSGLLERAAGRDSVVLTGRGMVTQRS